MDYPFFFRNNENTERTMKTAEIPFNYIGETFADIQVLYYQISGFNELTLKQKKLIYYLSQATLTGRDILWDQNGKYNLRIRKTLEAVYTNFNGNRHSDDFRLFTVYLKRIWFSNGIHHHYGCEKLLPGFSEQFLREAIKNISPTQLPLSKNQTTEDLCNEIFPVMFDPTRMSKRVNQSDGEDLIATSACNYYEEGITQQEAEDFYQSIKVSNDSQPVMYGMNSRLIKENGILKEQRWKSGGLYGEAIDKIVYWLEQATTVAENKTQQAVIEKLIEFYKNGDLKTFDSYAILWVKEQDSLIDFTNGFTESYGDPLGMKASWEGIVNYKDLEATKRTEKMSSNAQWFEDHSPIDNRFKKEECKGVSAKVVTAAMLGGDLYPSTAIGINLPNSNWIRAEYGSKSVTISNIIEAYNQAARGNGFQQEFVIDNQTLTLLNQYGDLCENLHTDLHECLGHGSGKLLPGVDPDALKAYGSTIEEARADLFGLYYLADEQMIKLGLMPNNEAYKAQYYNYMMNGLMTQLVRIETGKKIEEAHMRNRALIARWVYEKGKSEQVTEFVCNDNKTYIRINNYEKLRKLFGCLLAEVQRIKSEGDFEAARYLVENYAIEIDSALHNEILERYQKLHLAPYKGFINPQYQLQYDETGEIKTIRVIYGEAYDKQMLRYSDEYATLPYVNE